MEERQQLYAGLWNYEQDVPHREPLIDYVAESMACVLNKSPQNWVLVMIGGYEEVGNGLREFEKMVTARRGK